MSLPVYQPRVVKRAEKTDLFVKLLDDLLQLLLHFQSRREHDLLYQLNSLQSDKLDSHPQRARRESPAFPGSRSIHHRTPDLESFDPIYPRRLVLPVRLPGRSS